MTAAVSGASAVNPENPLYRARKRFNALVLVVASAALAFGLFWLVWILGTLFYEGSEAFIGTWWAALFPGVAIVATVLCFNIVGDALRRVLDPRHLRTT